MKFHRNFKNLFIIYKGYSFLLVFVIFFNSKYMENNILDYKIISRIEKLNNGDIIKGNENFINGYLLQPDGVVIKVGKNYKMNIFIEKLENVKHKRSKIIIPKIYKINTFRQDITRKDSFYKIIQIVDHESYVCSRLDKKEIIFFNINEVV